MRSTPESLRQPPADPQLVTLALGTRKGPGWDAPPTRRLQQRPRPPAATTPPVLPCPATPARRGLRGS
eukprot:11223391-Lingulodinium_polyedra.AAC.1